MIWRWITRTLKILYRKAVKHIFLFDQITFDNEVYFLRLTDNTIWQIEKKFGKAVFSSLKTLRTA